ncbi:MAG: zinc ribbon domain-containing protein [Clostridia bacterium]|nr:zinc ribbon domain-containing protein [Clostridia bacterium]
MTEKICVQCKTKNEEHYSFCKYCGASLPVVDRFDKEENQTHTAYKYAQPENTSNIDYGGVTEQELALYVGQNSGKIMPKFFAMQLVNKKTSWCFPVFLLGLAFGFFGMAFWFFSRKMIKVGAILAACGVLLTVSDAAINADTNKAFVGDLLSSYEAVISGNLDQTQLKNNINLALKEYEKNYNPVFSLATSYIGETVLPVIMAFFALGIYKTKAIKDILKIKQANNEDDLDNLRIQDTGGQSIALVIIPVALMILSGVSSLLFLI